MEIGGSGGPDDPLEAVESLVGDHGGDHLDNDEPRLAEVSGTGKLDEHPLAGTVEISLGNLLSHPDAHACADEHAQPRSVGQENPIEGFVVNRVVPVGVLHKGRPAHLRGKAIEGKIGQTRVVLGERGMFEELRVLVGHEGGLAPRHPQEDDRGVARLQVGRFGEEGPRRTGVFNGLRMERELDCRWLLRADPGSHRAEEDGIEKAPRGETRMDLHGDTISIL